MIDTPREVMHVRGARKAQESRLAAKNADRGDLSIYVKTGIKWAPTGHHMPHFWMPSDGLEGVKPLFSRKILQHGADSNARRARRYQQIGRIINHRGPRQVRYLRFALSPNRRE